MRSGPYCIAVRQASGRPEFFDTRTLASFAWQVQEIVKIIDTQTLPKDRPLNPPVVRIADVMLEEVRIEEIKQ